MTGSSIYERLAERTAAKVGDCVAAPPLALVDPIAPSMTKQDAVIWRLQRATRAAIGVERQRALLSALDATPAQARAAQAALLIWVDSVARLVQAAEDRHAGEHGAGEAKLAEVRADVLAAVGRGQAPFDGIPSAAAPWISETVTPWLAEALVFLANRYSLWGVPASPGPTRRAKRVRAAMRSGWRLLPRAVAFTLVAVSRSLARAGSALERVGSRLAGRGRETASPLVAVSTRSALAPAVSALRWIGRERTHLIAAVDLVAGAVALADAEPGMNDRAGAAYAADVVLLVLEDMGLDTRAPVTLTLCEAIASVSVVAVRRHLRAGSLVVDESPRERGPVRRDPRDDAAATASAPT